MWVHAHMIRAQTIVISIAYHNLALPKSQIYDQIPQRGPQAREKLTILRQPRAFSHPHQRCCRRRLSSMIHPPRHLHGRSPVPTIRPRLAT